jgi:hypothetical protein
VGGDAAVQVPFPGADPDLEASGVELGAADPSAEPAVLVGVVAPSVDAVLAASAVGPFVETVDPYLADPAFEVAGAEATWGR